MDKGKGLEVVKERRGRKQWVRRINNASVMMSMVVETLTDKRGFAVEALLDLLKCMEGGKEGEGD